jgi:hypothetical protein
MADAPTPTQSIPAKSTTSSSVIKTTATGVTAVALVPFVDWLCNGCPMPPPAPVEGDIAAALLVTLHFGYASITTLAERWGIKLPASNPETAPPAA